MTGARKLDASEVERMLRMVGGEKDEGQKQAAHEQVEQAIRNTPYTNSPELGWTPERVLHETHGAMVMVKAFCKELYGYEPTIAFSFSEDYSDWSLSVNEPMFGFPLLPAIEHQPSALNCLIVFIRGMGYAISQMEKELSDK